MLQFHELPLWLNVTTFGAGAVAIWLAGTRLSGYADAIAERTGLGHAFVGALLLGGITSLPEGATTVAASAIGNAPLAVNNILGGVAMQVTILAIADAIIPGGALSARALQPAVLLQGALLILMLALAAAGMAVGDRLFFGVGLWSVAIFVATLAAFLLIHQSGSRGTWEVARRTERALDEDESRRHGNAARGHSTAHLAIASSIAALVILIAGVVVARSGDALAIQTGLGSSFVGVLLVAVATSMPEVSTTLAAARLGLYGLAISSIFGANILDLALLLPADVAFPGGPVLNEVGRFSLVAALLGILLTAIYLVGLLERRKRVVLGLGLDSLLVLSVYVGGIWLLFTLG
ncbi:MAG: sodium:calcium antiporter [Pseudomonadales bacterium]